MNRSAIALVLAVLALAGCASGRVTGDVSWSGEVESSDGAWSLRIDAADVGVTLATMTPAATDTATPTLAPTATRTATPTAAASPTAAAAGVSKVAGNPVAGSPYAAGFRIVGGSLAFSRGTQVSGDFYERFDSKQGTVSLWLTPEWAGGDGARHEFLRWSANGGIYKAVDGRLYASFSPTVTLSVDVSGWQAGWQAGVRHRIEVRWDSANPIDAAGNHVAISIDDAHTYGVTAAWAPEQPAAQIFVGSDAAGANHVAGQINGLVISRSVWYDGSAGTDTYWGEDVVGASGSKTSGFPYGGLSAPFMGVWDVVAALPTNRVLGPAASGAVDGWSMPHAVNLLAGGFSAPADGTTWALPALTPGADYVVRGVGWSDGASVPRLTVWDATAGAELAHLDGSATSTRRRPDNILYSFELPTTARGAPANTTAIEVRLQNAGGEGSTTWGQVELYRQLEDNPSFETGGGDPWVPHGWVNDGALPGEIRQGATGHTGKAVRIVAPGTNHHGILWAPNAFGAAYTYRAWGGWMSHPGTDPNSCYHREQGRNFRDTNGAFVVNVMAGLVPGWRHHGSATMRTLSDGIFVRDQIFNGASGCVEGLFDDVYMFNLPALQIEVTQ